MQLYFQCYFNKLLLFTGLTGVRYMTEDIMRKVTKQNNVEAITNLNLALSKEGGKKIKVTLNILHNLHFLQIFYTCALDHYLMLSAVTS